MTSTVVLSAVAKKVELAVPLMMITPVPEMLVVMGPPKRPPEPKLKVTGLVVVVALTAVALEEGDGKPETVPTEYGPVPLLVGDGAPEMVPAGEVEPAPPPLRLPPVKVKLPLVPVPTGNTVPVPMMAVPVPVPTMMVAVPTTTVPEEPYPV